MPASSPSSLLTLVTNLVTVAPPGSLVLSGPFLLDSIYISNTDSGALAPRIYFTRDGGATWVLLLRGANISAGQTAQFDFAGKYIGGISVGPATAPAATGLDVQLWGRSLS